MTEEQQLYDIKNAWKECMTNGFSLDSEDTTWLIEQAEQKQHLERKYENTGSMFGRQNQALLIEENKKLREAVLQIESWTKHPREREPSIYTLNQICRQTLEGLKNEN